MEPEGGARPRSLPTEQMDMKDILTKELVSAVRKGEEDSVRTALARGGRPEVTFQAKEGVSVCLVGLAAIEGHGHLLPCLLEAGLSLEGRGASHYTPLILAASKGRVETVESLLTLGADPLATDSAGRTALHYAAMFNCHLCVAALARVTPPTSVHVNLLHVASHQGWRKVVEVLADAGWSLTARDSNGRTPLHWAAGGGSVDVAMYLVQRGLDPRQEDNDGNTSLDVAVGCRQHAMEAWLAKNGGAKEATKELISAVQEGDEARVKDALARGGRPEVTQPTDEGVSWGLVNLASREGHSHLLPHLLEAGLSLEGGGTVHCTPLMVAAARGHVRTVETLLTLGANPLATDKGDRTALYYAAGGGHKQCVDALTPVIAPIPTDLEAFTPVHVASYRGHKNVVEVLADAGWPLNTKDSDGWTPLHWAARGGNVDVAKYLVRQGLDLHQDDHLGCTPLDVAVESNQHTMKAWLVENGGTRGVTQALIRAVQKGDEARLKTAITTGGRPEVTFPTTSSDSRCLVGLAACEGHSHLLPYLLRAGLSMEGADTSNCTPLMQAAGRNHAETIKVLLTLGADPLATDSGGWTALHYAALKGHQQCVDTLTPIIPPTPVHLEAVTPVHIASSHGHRKVVEMLADAGWPLTARDINGWTPLHFAAWGGCKDVVNYLVERQLDPRPKNHAGHTPLDVAVEYGRYEVEAWLVKNVGAGTKDEAHRLVLVRQQQRWNKKTHDYIVSCMTEGNEVALTNIPEDLDGHVVNGTGLTPLHVAAERGLPSKVVQMLLQRGVDPHIVTTNNMTPADLARRGKHLDVLKSLLQHKCEQDKSTPDELHEELLTVISSGDDVQAVSRYLCKGAPMESLGSRSLSALRLAVTTDRSRTLSLLLARGASLSAGLLQDAWQSPDVTPRVLATLTTVSILAGYSHNLDMDELGEGCH